MAARGDGVPFWGGGGIFNPAQTAQTEIAVENGAPVRGGPAECRARRPVRPGGIAQRNNSARRRGFVV